MAYGPTIDKVLSKVNDVASVYVEEYDGTNEWFLIAANDLSDDDLFYELRRKWYQIVGSNYARFALVYCVQRPDCGVWIHYLPASFTPAVFALGCFKVSSWE